MDVAITAELNGKIETNEYRGMSAKMIVTEISELMIGGQKIVAIADLNEEN